MAKGKARSLIKLVSSAGTGHFYVTTKARPTGNAASNAKLMFRKYDPFVKKSVIYHEAKLK